jgi:hypothetical protein
MGCKTSLAVCALSLLLAPPPLRAQLEILPDDAAQTVFSGEARRVRVTFRNPSALPLETAIRTRLYQASSSTVAPLGEPRNWKNLQVLPGQTVLESILLAFPPVKNETRFLVQWLDETNGVLGKTDVLAYPTNLLEALKPLAGETPLGILDPQNQLKPLLKGVALEFVDLADTGFENFTGKLAVIGPFQSRAQMHEGLANQIQALAKKGRAIVWIQPPPEKRDRLQPSFYFVRQNATALVIVQPDQLAGLPVNPRSQLNLVYFCQLALRPEPFPLPHPAR